MPLAADLVDRIGKIILLMSSDNDGDKLSAARALGRTLKAGGVDHHALVEHMKESRLNDDDKELFRAELKKADAVGYARGLRDAEAKQYGVDDFRNTDGSTDWRRVALYVQHEKRLLLEKHHKFVDDMAARVPFNREPTPRQLAYLQSLFLKLGGRIT
jgi:hypothetical protein